MSKNKNKNFMHNPILAENIFVPDAEAHVWEDGRIYIYGSFDIQGRRAYCSDEYHVYSSDNMVDWTDHGVSFSLKDIDWIDDKDGGYMALYAPDCAYRDGKYYLYYCIPGGKCGVAYSDKPYGPFTDIGQIEHVEGIDPAVFIDDDGQAYLYWGQFDRVRVAKLKDNMTEIEPETAVQPLSVAEHEFHEGSSMRKINGKYYYLFTDTHRHGGKACCLGYAVSDNPMTGFRYGSVIIDNYSCDPKTWNNHGSIECFKGQWYVFYHRSTHCSENSRHVCVERININADGSIDEAEMTSSGAGEFIPADAVVPACYACGLEGNVRIAGDGFSRHTLALTGIQPGDIAVFRYIGFDGENFLTLRIKSDRDCTVEVYIDENLHASAPVKPGNDYAEYDIRIAPIFGKHTVKFKFTGEFESAAFDEFLFKREE